MQHISVYMQLINSNLNRSAFSGYVEGYHHH